MPDINPENPSKPTAKVDQCFRVATIARTRAPQQVVYAALHQDYSEEFVMGGRAEFPPEPKAGELVVKRLLAGNRGHYGPLEHPQITLNCGWFPHSVMQQARTHRVSVSFDVQSGRYTGKRILDVVAGTRDVEEVFYLRPVGQYRDRQGKNYEYTQEHRDADRTWVLAAAERYSQDLGRGLSEEHARGKIPFDIRQHFVVSFNLRSLMHFLDLRYKADAQLEIQQLCELIYPHFEGWVPEIAEWYTKGRKNKALLAP